MLAPYWAKRPGKTVFRAFQASRRGGEIICRLARDRIELEGTCVFYLEGNVEILDVHRPATAPPRKGIAEPGAVVNVCRGIGSPRKNHIATDVEGIVLIVIKRE